MSEFRGFIAVEIPICENLLAFHTKLENLHLKMKLVDLKNIHITLKFLGETKIEHIDEIEKIIKNAVQNIQPFSIQLKGTGVFPNSNYIKVVWIGISESSLLSTIAASIDNQLTPLGYKKEKRPFSPHLTIGRIKYLNRKHDLLAVLDSYKDNLFSNVCIDHILLKKSTLTPKGPIYETIREIKL
jgi:RNA 2',3'-cyclic 3'-phosphodiesterase